MAGLLCSWFSLDVSLAWQWKKFVLREICGRNYGCCGILALDYAISFPLDSRLIHFAKTGLIVRRVFSQFEFFIAKSVRRELRSIQVMFAISSSSTGSFEAILSKSSGFVYSLQMKVNLRECSGRIGFCISSYLDIYCSFITTWKPWSPWK